MSTDALSDAARRLILEHIDSVGRLDLLLVLYGDPRDRWTAARMARQMRAPEKWTLAQLRALTDAGILRCDSSGADPAWSYDPADEPRSTAVQELVTACRLDWPAVTEVVATRRPSGAQAFSDAFRLRRGDG